MFNTLSRRRAEMEFKLEGCSPPERHNPVIAISIYTDYGISVPQAPALRTDQRADQRLKLLREMNANTRQQYPSDIVHSEGRYVLYRRFGNLEPSWTAACMTACDTNNALAPSSGIDNEDILRANHRLLPDRSQEVFGFQRTDQIAQS